MAKNKSYIIRTTAGNEREYSHEDMLNICEQYLKQQGINSPSESEIENEISDFVSRFKYVEKEEE